MARTAKQLANLKPFDKNQNREEAKKNGAKGGKKSGEARRQKRDARQAAKYILDLSVTKQFKQNLTEFGVDESGFTNIVALQAKLFQMAMNGNLEATRELLKIAGYDQEYERKERESVAAEKRKDAESKAKIEALGGSVPNAQIAVNTQDEEGYNDVVIYLPEIQKPEDCELPPEEETEEKPSESKE